jgi:hypothetical protein
MRRRGVAAGDIRMALIAELGFGSVEVGVALGATFFVMHHVAEIHVVGLVLILEPGYFLVLSDVLFDEFTFSRIGADDV